MVRDVGVVGDDERGAVEGRGERGGDGLTDGLAAGPGEPDGHAAQGRAVELAPGVGEEGGHDRGGGLGAVTKSLRRRPREPARPAAGHGERGRLRAAGVDPHEQWSGH